MPQYKHSLKKLIYCHKKFTVGRDDGIQEIIEHAGKRYFHMRQ